MWTAWVLVALAGLASRGRGETLGACDTVGETLYVKDWPMLLCDRTGRRISAGNTCRESIHGGAGRAQGRLIIDLGGSSPRPEWHFPELCLPGQRQQRQKDPWKCHCTNKNIWDCAPSADHFIYSSGRGSGGDTRSIDVDHHNSTTSSPRALGKKYFWYCDEFGSKHALVNCIFDHKMASIATKELKKFDLPGFDVHDCLPGNYGTASE